MATTQSPQKPPVQNTTNEPAPLPTVTPAAEKTNGVAIAAIILTFFFPLIGLILGIVALSSIKKSGEKGKGLAKAAIIISTILIVFGIALVGFVTYSIQKAAKDAGLNVNNGSITATNKNGESVSVGNDVKLPSGFPSDVPIYEPSEVKAAVTTKKDTYAVTLVSSDASTKVNEYYNQQLPKDGWVGGADNAQFDTGSGKLASYTKGDRTLTVIIAADQSSSKDKTSIVLTVGPTSASE